MRSLFRIKGQRNHLFTNSYSSHMLANLMKLLTLVPAKCFSYGCFPSLLWPLGHPTVNLSSGSCLCTHPSRSKTSPPAACPGQFETSQ